MMTVKIRVSKKAAILAGHSTWGEIPIQVGDEWMGALTDKMRRELVTLDASRDALGDDVRLDLSNGYAHYEPIGVEVAEATPETARTLLAGRCLARQRGLAAVAAQEAAADAKKAKAIAAAKAQAAKWAALPLDYRASADGVGVRRPVPDEAYSGPLTPGGYGAYDAHELREYAPEAWAEAEAEAKRLRDERERAKAEAQAERDRAEQLAAHEWRKALDAWVQINAEEDYPRRMGRHMPDDEVLALIRDAAFEPARTFQRFDRLDADEVCDCEGTEIVSFSVVEVEVPLTPAQFEQLSSLRTLLPGAEVTPRVHIGTCDQCSARLERLSMLATVDWHNRKLSREFAL